MSDKWQNVSWEDWFYLDNTSASGLRWKVDRHAGAHNSVKLYKGDRAGSKDSRTYWVVMLDHKRYGVHRIVWEMHNNAVVPENMDVDHMDGNPYNNCLTNLTLKTKAGSVQNRKMLKNNTSGVTGVANYVSKGMPYTQAYWREGGKPKTEKFWHHKMTPEEAWEAACEFRKNKIEELNRLGANYTERHGKEVE